MINNEELYDIKGGAAKYMLGFAIGAALSFIIGVIDGYLRPLKCNG